MADEDVITIPVDLQRSEADAFARLLKRLNYTDCSVRSNPVRKYPDGREEKDVMWSAVCRVQTQFGEAGFAPR
jgi:hypothetical protein